MTFDPGINCGYLIIALSESGLARGAWPCNPFMLLKKWRKKIKKFRALATVPLVAASHMAIDQEAAKGR